MKYVHFIINPAAGQEEPILTYINTVFKDTSIHWTISVTKEFGDAFTQAKEAVTQKADCVVSYGGDGTIMEIARALYKTDTPLGILPGGTANIFARELEIPLSTQDALKLLTQTYHVKDVDMGLFNGDPFFIRLSYGFLADMVEETKRKMKDKLGRGAYVVSALKNITKEPIEFIITIDGKEITRSAKGLAVSNTGNIGVGNLVLSPRVSMLDQKLDVIIFQDANLSALSEWVASAVTGERPSQTIEHFQGKEIVIQTKNSQRIIVDDTLEKVKKSVIQVMPKALRVIVP